MICDGNGTSAGRRRLMLPRIFPGENTPRESSIAVAQAVSNKLMSLCQGARHSSLVRVVGRCPCKAGLVVPVQDAKDAKGRVAFRQKNQIRFFSWKI